MQEKYNVTGMTCAACQARVQKSVSKLTGVQECNVNLLKNSMVVTYDDKNVNSGQIIAAVEKAGYGASLQQVKGKSAAQAVSPVDTAKKQSNGGTTMKKELMIEGMMCQNCVKHVTHALEGISGASHVQVSLEDKKATVEVPESVTDETLKAAVTEAGYKVTEIIPHEG